MLNQVESSLERRMTAFSAFAGMVATTGAIVVLAGWIFNLQVLKGIFPGFATMKANTALGILLCGASLWMKVRGGRKDTADRLAECAGAAAAMLALLTLAEYLTHSNFGIDELLFRDAQTAPANFPGRMSIATAICIACCGGASLLLDRVRRLSQVLSIICLIISMLALIGYSYDLDALYRLVPYSSMAIHTASLLWLTSLGQLMSRPRQCVHRLLVSPSAGGALARRMLPWTVLLPLGIGALTLWGERRGLYDAQFRTPILTLVVILVIAVLIWWNATLLDRSDSRRERLERDRADLLGRERSARERAEGAVTARDQLLSIVSHELRTPLTPALLMASALQNRLDLPADVQEDISTIRTQIQVEARLIDDLLDLVAIRQGKLTLRRTPVNLQQIVERVTALHREQFNAKGLKLVSDLPADEVNAEADDGRIQQVLSNLFSNSLKFTPAGGTVTVRTYNAPRHQFVIEVADTGIGISPDALPKVFDMFEQADKSITRPFGGLGIGLALCRTLVDMHGGSIRAVSEGTNLGTTVIISLPAKATAGPKDSPASSIAAQSQKLRILIVEDNRESMHVLERLLGTLGHDIVATSTALQALQAAGDRTFDLLISDIGLPDVSGWELMRMLRRERQQSIRGIALSGFVAEEDRQRSLDAGYISHLGKPIDFGMLMKAIDGAMSAKPPGLLV